MNYKNMIFDIDGTLIDTDMPVLKTWLFTLKEFGFQYSLSQLQTILGITTEAALSQLNIYFRKFDFKSLFPIIICADDTKKHKPLPDPIYKYLELSHSQKSDYIYIGDMPTDMKCAVNAGISFGFAAWSRPSTLCPKADFRFDSPRDLQFQMTG